MALIIQALLFLLDVYLWIIIASIVVSWLTVFGVLNTRNKYVYQGCELLNRLTNPLIFRIRRVLPIIGGIDLSPVIIIIGISLLQRLLYGML